MPNDILKLEIRNDNNSAWPEDLYVSLLDENLKIASKIKVGSIDPGHTVICEFKFDDSASITKNLQLQFKHTQHLKRIKYFSKKTKIMVRKGF